MISYSDRAEVIFPAQPVEDKEALKSRIARIRPGAAQLFTQASNEARNRSKGISPADASTG